MDNFSQELTSIWSFRDRGDWNNHKGDYPGNCSPRVIRNLLLKYTKENDTVLDQFLGSGTTAIEVLLLNRKIIGIDINKKALDISNCRIKDLNGNKILKVGNAEKLEISNETVNFICTHPPYLDIIKYSKDIEGDLSLLNKVDFYTAIKNVANECYRVLKFKSKCAIIIGDVRKKGYIEPLGFNVMNIFLSTGFLLKEIIIKEQHNCKSTDKWKEIAKQKNFLLIQHEYIFVFEKNYFK
ncbi:DNA modification methylase [Clostridium saccharoperbutylacetonicum]|uniref:Methyltransferase n=1 Tax=Clostridium saccharoperbutylacetonicum N1-4(HMT) TaxID=931276 RepID=M1MNP0_9CLOT|nr:DNA methyltransferase [Clostridium saccharoperbutylacetonicum]AGF57808.1 DNA methylase [Clostridium saccharoperbutylacetonicum N1-4(HMT)]NRT61422.1 DNA modification methylase [Clostridium saccharoperbutylacetonicum]NSB24741.1 DNA modification methylase [Clostridium saccharoperbutylacetonicum]NSB44114.1 DNA modification methylase [Clostridium saccharoperbutylacetonicum]